MMRKPFSSCYVILCCLISLAGCGYHLRGYGDALPKDINTITILAFSNDTYEADMDILLSRSLSEEFSKARRLAVVSGKDADVELSGLITSLTANPISFSSSDLVQEYRLEVSVDVTLARRGGGEVVWKTRGLKRINDYKVVPGDTGATESNRFDAKRKVADELAELIYDHIFEGF